MGFNYECLKEKDEIYGIWDMGGKESIRNLWMFYYKNIKFNGLVFLIDAFKENDFDEARFELNKLINEEELRNIVVAVVFNLNYSSANIDELT